MFGGLESDFYLRGEASKMLYLISGTSRSGKSIVSRRLLKEKGIPYMPLDSIVMGFTQGVPEYGVHDKLFPDEIARRMWRFVKPVCENLMFVGQDYTVEGEAFLPANIRELSDQQGGQIRTCFLGYCDMDVQRKVREIKTHSEGSNDWLVKESDDYIRDHVTNMLGYSKYIREECRIHRIAYFDVSRDFNGAMDEAVRYLLSSR